MFVLKKWAVVIAVFAVMLLTGCMQTSIRSNNAPLSLTELTLTDGCQNWLMSIEQPLNAWQQLPDYPLLRINRFWASFAQNSTQQTLTPEQRNFWLQQVQRESLINWQLALQQHGLGSAHNLNQVERCHHEWREQVSGSRLSIAIPDNYSMLQRVLGLYPITQVGVQLGAAQWRKAAQLQLKKGSDAVMDMAWQRYHLPTTDSKFSPASLLVAASQNPLQIPLPSHADQQLLFNHFAPQINIQNGGDYDRIGQLTVTGFSTAEPTLYTAVSHTRWHGQNLLQLNYVIWFSERPATGWLDILAGDVDSLIWRVTLLPDGQVLAYDSIHSCGCYHLVFPNPEFTKPFDQFQSTLARDVEPPVIHRLQPFPTQAEPTNIWLQSGTHYLMDVTITPPIENVLPIQAMEQANYAGLYPLFDAEGLLPNTQRLERWLLWPTGIISPGQMRVMGTQATAFTGKRHFDDATIFEAFFEPNDTAE